MQKTQLWTQWQDICSKQWYNNSWLAGSHSVRDWLLLSMKRLKTIASCCQLIRQVNHSSQPDWVVHCIQTNESFNNIIDESTIALNCHEMIFPKTLLAKASELYADSIFYNQKPIILYSYWGGQAYQTEAFIRKAISGWQGVKISSRKLIWSIPVILLQSSLNLIPCNGGKCQVTKSWVTKTEPNGKCLASTQTFVCYLWNCCHYSYRQLSRLIWNQ